MGIVVDPVMPRPVEPTEFQDWYLVSNYRIVHAQGYSYGEGGHWWHFKIPWDPYDLDINGLARTTGLWEMVRSLEEARARFRTKVLEQIKRYHDTLNALDEGTFHIHELTSSPQ